MATPTTRLPTVWTIHERLAPILTPQSTASRPTAAGNSLSINTASLDLSLSVTPGSTQSVNFTITGGGAQFQLGPEVVSSQQVRVGITSVNTAKLGGVSGKLFQLGSGGTADLATDPTTAASIVDQAINQITSLRGRLGAFQTHVARDEQERLERHVGEPGPTPRARSATLTSRAKPRT